MIDCPDNAAPEFVPPFATGKIPVTAVVNPTLPQNGANPTPPLNNTFPTAISASLANVVAVLAYKISPTAAPPDRFVFVPPFANGNKPVTLVARSIVPLVISPFTTCPNTGAPPVPRNTVLAGPTTIVDGAVAGPPPMTTPLAVSSAEEAMVMLLLK